MAAEVIAIEVKQYVGTRRLRTLVPRAVGQTAAAERRKRPRESRQWMRRPFSERLRRSTVRPSEARRELMDGRERTAALLVSVAEQADRAQSSTTRGISTEPIARCLQP